MIPFLLVLFHVRYIFNLYEIVHQNLTIKPKYSKINKGHLCIIEPTENIIVHICKKANLLHTSCNYFPSLFIESQKYPSSLHKMDWSMGKSQHGNSCLEKIVFHSAEARKFVVTLSNSLPLMPT